MDPLPPSHHHACRVSLLGGGGGKKEQAANAKAAVLVYILLIIMQCKSWGGGAFLRVLFFTASFPFGVCVCALRKGDATLDRRRLVVPSTDGVFFLGVL